MAFNIKKIGQEVASNNEKLVTSLNAAGKFDAAHKAATDAATGAVDAVKELAKQTGKKAKNDDLAKAAKQAYTRAFKDVGHAKLAGGSIKHTFINGVRTVTGSFGDATSKLGGMTSRKPGLLTKSALAPFNATFGAMKRMPVVTALGTAGLAVIGGSKLLGGRKTSREQAQYQDQMQEMAAMQQQTTALEQQAALMEQQARLSQDNATAAQYGGGMPSYKNSVSTEEAAYMNSQMRDSSAQGFAQAEQNRRTAAQQAPGNLGE